MIQSTELRIGNYVFDHLGRVQKVAETRADAYICYLSNGAKLKYKLNTTQPIPLTEEWLLKFGFEKSAQNFDYFQRVKYFDYSIKVGFHKISFIIDEFGYLKAATNTYVKAVHQLQNLYFALVNSELQLLEAGILT